MRRLLTPLLACTIAAGLQLPNLQPFLTAVSPLLDQISLLTTSNSTEHELLKRQNSNGCPAAGWNNCGSVGVSAFCCAPSAVCTADAANRLACCPSGASCTGTIGGYITSGTVDNNGNPIGGAAAATTGTTATVATTSTSGYVVATTTTTTGATVSTGNGFIIASGATVAQPGRAARGVEIVSSSEKLMVIALTLWQADTRAWTAWHSRLSFVIS